MLTGRVCNGTAPLNGEQAQATLRGSDLASCGTRRILAKLFRRIHRLCCTVLHKHIMPGTVVFFKLFLSFHRLAGFYLYLEWCCLRWKHFGNALRLRILRDSREVNRPRYDILRQLCLTLVNKLPV